MHFYEINTTVNRKKEHMKADWLALKALCWHYKHRVNCDNTKFREIIAYFGGPSFWRGPCPFGDWRSRGPPTSGTLPMIIIFLISMLVFWLHKCNFLALPLQLNAQTRLQCKHKIFMELELAWIPVTSEIKTRKMCFNSWNVHKSWIHIATSNRVAKSSRKCGKYIAYIYAISPTFCVSSPQDFLCHFPQNLCFICPGNL